MQFPLIVWISGVIGFAIISYSLPDFRDKIQFTSWATLTVLILTLITLVWYTYDTHRITEQTVQANLRPIVLVQGVINWDSLAFTSGPNGTILGPQIQFVILKNTALDFHGYIVINNQKYNLIFGNIISSQNDPDTNTSRNLFFKTWGWVPPNGLLNAIYDPNVLPTAIAAPNGIFLEYSDTEGNSYHSTVDANYVQKSVIGS